MQGVHAHRAFAPDTQRKIDLSDRLGSAVTVALDIFAFITLAGLVISPFAILCWVFVCLTMT